MTRILQNMLAFVDTGFLYVFLSKSQTFLKPGWSGDGQTDWGLNGPMERKMFGLVDRQKYGPIYEWM